MSNRGYMGNWIGSNSNPTPVCEHNNRTNNGTRYCDCNDCGQPLVFVNMQWMIDSEAIKRRQAQQVTVPVSKLTSKMPIQDRVLALLKFIGSNPDLVPTSTKQGIEVILLAEDDRKQQLRANKRRGVQ